MHGLPQPAVLLWHLSCAWLLIEIRMPTAGNWFSCLHTRCAHGVWACNWLQAWWWHMVFAITFHLLPAQLKNPENHVLLIFMLVWRGKQNDPKNGLGHLQL